MHTAILDGSGKAGGPKQSLVPLSPLDVGTISERSIGSCMSAYTVCMDQVARGLQIPGFLPHVQQFHTDRDCPADELFCPVLQLAMRLP